MTAEAHDARALLDAWKASGADRIDPVRFRMLDAFARRAASHDGGTRRTLDDRLAALLAAYASDIEQAERPAADDGATAPARSQEPGALAALNEYIARNAQTSRASWPELEMLDYFRDTWSGISIDRQWRQSRDQVPTNAGPLNSSSLVHRALSLMREQSPGYLQHFMSYVDALSWMEQMSGSDIPKDTRRATTAKKGARSRSR